jgi:hypothetical protein
MTGPPSLGLEGLDRVFFAKIAMNREKKFNRFLIIFQKTTVKFCFFKTNHFGGAVNHGATFLRGAT